MSGRRKSKAKRRRKAQPVNMLKEMAAEVAFEGAAQGAARLPSLVANAISGAAKAVGGGDFGGAGAAGEWDVASISLPSMTDISLPDLPNISLIDFIDL